MKRERGFTLLEVIVAIALLGIVAVAIYAGLATASKAISTADERTTAESLARSQMDSIQNQAYDSANTTPVYSPISDIPDSYSIVTPFAARLDPMGDGIANDDGLQKITVTVKHNNEIIFTMVDYKVNYNP